MSGVTLAKEIENKCKGKCEYFDECHADTVARAEVSDKEIDKDYGCKMHPDK